MSHTQCGRVTAHKTYWFTRCARGFHRDKGEKYLKTSPYTRYYYYYYYCVCVYERDDHRRAIINRESRKVVHVHTHVLFTTRGRRKGRIRVRRKNEKINKKIEEKKLCEKSPFAFALHTRNAPFAINLSRAKVHPRK